MRKKIKKKKNHKLITFVLIRTRSQAKRNPVVYPIQ